MRYIVEITETLQKQIIVNANNEEQAQEMAEELYYTGEEVLYAEDLKETKFEVLGENIVYSTITSGDSKKYCIVKLEDGYQLLVKEFKNGWYQTAKVYDEIYLSRDVAIKELKKIKEKVNE